jgi:hypothetical protein
MEKALEKLQDDDDLTTLPNELTWTNAQESILVGWSDKASCYRWLHEGSERFFENLNNWLTIPVIVMSTVAGTSNFALASLFNNQVANYVIGSITLTCGLISTLSKFLRVGEKIEAHHVASMRWGKLNRLISSELSLRRDQRVNCQGFIKIARAEVDRLIEMSPNVPIHIISQFKREFSDNIVLSKPEICHGIEHTVVCVDMVASKSLSLGSSYRIAPTPSPSK